MDTTFFRERRIGIYMTISTERKEKILQQRAGKDPKPLSQLAQDVGISIKTLYAWRTACE